VLLAPGWAGENLPYSIHHRAPIEWDRNAIAWGDHDYDRRAPDCPQSMTPCLELRPKRVQRL
jgi:hypothetical protein